MVEICFRTAIALVLVFASECAFAGEAEKCTNEETLQLAKEAFAFGYPFVEIERLKRLHTNPKNPINRITHRSHPIQSNDAQIPGPDSDFLYSTAFLDLSKNAVILEIPPMKKRYFVLQLLGFDNATKASVGTSSSDTNGGRFLIAGPKWGGDTGGYRRVIQLPTYEAWLIGRTHFDVASETDLAEAKKLQGKIRLVRGPTMATPTPAPSIMPPALAINDRIPAASPSASPTPAPSVRPTPPKKDESLLPSAKDMSAKQFFSVLAAALWDQPTQVREIASVTKFTKIGLKAGESFPFDAIPASAKSCLIDGVEAAKVEIAKGAENLAKKLPNSNWAVNLDISNFGERYLPRAIAAWALLGALEPEEVVHFATQQDSAGEVLNGQSRYVLRFEKDQIPTVEGFWSIHVQGERTPIYGQKLRTNDDGSIDIFLQADEPTDEKEKRNWLSLPKTLDSKRDLKIGARFFIPDAMMVSQLRIDPPGYSIPDIKKRQ